MDYAGREVLKQMKAEIKMNLNLDDILDELEANDTISPDSAEKIKAQQTNSEKITFFLNVLQRRGPDAFTAFIEALKKDYKFLADILNAKYTEELKTLEDNHSGDSGTDSLPEQSETVPKAVDHNVHKATDTHPDLSSRQQFPCLPGQVQPSSVHPAHQSSLHLSRLSHLNHLPSRRSSLQSTVDFGTHQSLTGMYTKLKTHLFEVDLREPSFCESPVQITFDMVDSLLNQLLKIEDDCYKVLGVGKRSSLLTHVIDLKESKKQLQEILKLKEKQVQKYADKVLKLQTTCKDTASKLHSTITTNQVLAEENERLRQELLVLKQAQETTAQEDGSSNTTDKSFIFYDQDLKLRLRKYEEEIELLHRKLNFYKHEQSKIQRQQDSADTCRASEHEDKALSNLVKGGKTLSQMINKGLFAGNTKNSQKHIMKRKPEALFQIPKEEHTRTDSHEVTAEGFVEQNEQTQRKRSDPITSLTMFATAKPSSSMPKPAITQKSEVSSIASSIKSKGQHGSRKHPKWNRKPLR